ncbi:MAG TPA: hypothetical protein VF184_04655 [Phycisphaeraceae bacterium]
MNRSRKVLLTVLGLGLTALGVDRLFLGGSTGPQTATADVQAPLMAAADSASAATLGAAAASSPATSAGPTLAQRLLALARDWDETASAQPVRDAFSPSPAWTGPGSSQADEPAQALAVDPAVQFQKQHRLMAVVARRSGGLAVVDSRTIALGQSLDGFRLIQVRDDAAVFESSSGTRLELRLHPAAR